MSELNLNCPQRVDIMSFATAVVGPGGDHQKKMTTFDQIEAFVLKHCSTRDDVGAMFAAMASVRDANRKAHLYLDIEEFFLSPALDIYQRISGRKAGATLA